MDRLVVAIFVLLSGCTRPNPDYCSNSNDCANGLVCNPMTQACEAVDAAAPDAQTCAMVIGKGLYRICLTEQPTTPIAILSLTTIDTGNSPLCLPQQPPGWTEGGQPEACFVVATTIDVRANWKAKGARPLVLVAIDSIHINGHLDSASHAVELKRGPGSPSPACATFTVLPTSGSTSGGGGAGASFTTGGGTGGSGNPSANGGEPTASMQVPSVLRAGCDGQRGGNGQQAAGDAGYGGGALYVASANMITLGASGWINAAGGGGFVGDAGAGGSGGGSGGMIVLHASAISAALGASVIANGGGGGAGQGTSGSAMIGGEQDWETPLAPATGGTGFNGGNGGSGAGGTGFTGSDYPALAGQGGTTNQGGGGGGGGRGYIESTVMLDNAVSAPAAVIVP